MLKNEVEALKTSLSGSLTEAMVTFSAPMDSGRKFDTVAFEHLIHNLFPDLVEKYMDKLLLLILKDFENKQGE